MDTSTKVIVASKSRLQLKYGTKYSKISPLLKKLVAADKKRGIDTKIWLIDDADSSKALNLKAVKRTTPKDCKGAIDALYSAHAPDYIVILGAQDAFPFQDLNNPTDDEDASVPSDLPYACEAAYSNDPNKFLGPTRVVGRIPDIPDQADVDYLTKVLTRATDYKKLPGASYGNFFAVSAKVWQKSTQKSLMAAFGQNKGLKLSPSSAPSGGYTPKDLSSITHFYNCHGAMDDPRFWGQKSSTSPIDWVALDAGNLSGKIAEGTVVAAECCYGANLFNPDLVTTDGTPSIANNYLGHGALAFLGSSTIAYGPSDEQGQADYITQFFVSNVLRGASTGRALLEARQKFLTITGPNLDPVDIKTIAQFYLLGDPSIAPVEQEQKVAVPVLTDSAKGTTAKSVRMVTENDNTVENRRRNLLMKGISLANSTAGPQKVSSDGLTDSAPVAKAARTRGKAAALPEKEKRLNALLKQAGFDEYTTSSTYQSDSPVAKSMKAGFAKGMLDQTTQFRTFTKLKQETPAGHVHGERTVKPPMISRNEIMVVKENDDSILRWRVYQAR